VEVNVLQGKPQTLSRRQLVSYKGCACVPHDFLPCQAYLIFYERDDKPSEGNTSDMTYLVRQGQQEVVEEDGDDRD
jgi:hypothetical protein